MMPETCQRLMLNTAANIKYYVQIECNCSLFHDYYALYL